MQRVLENWLLLPLGDCVVVIRNGKPVETSMKFPTVAGLPMGKRNRGLDPGTMLFLMQKNGMTFH
jgi:acetate kinase